MASSPDFIQYVADQLSDAGEITYRKMFGEYGIYCDGKFFAMVCEDHLFVKVTPEGEALMPDLPKAPAYEGSKPCFLVEDVDDRHLLTTLARETCRALPEPKPKKPKKPKVKP
ncbi:TfoX/Sxy family protein [Ihubacter sp. mB4P-1]|uniref:TfoX/Sxy family protein n=1 Tax=Ihubacter sp. mB4P-1 TaxID=3242370 RepID=UPI001379FEEF